MAVGRVRGWAATMLVPVLALAACRPAGGDPGTVTVLAAASLADAFDVLAERYAEATDGVDEVRVSVAGSQQLATQVLEGAPADVLASADRRQMARVVDAGMVAEPPRVFVHNQPAVVVPAGNPRGVDDLADLADPSLAVVLAAPEVPAGRYARQLLATAGVAVDPVSLEADVRGVLAKVALGEADAGIVYASDVVASDADVERVEVAAAADVVAAYPIAPLADGPNPAGGVGFVAFVHGDVGRSVLARFGFRVGERP